MVEANRLLDWAIYSMDENKTFLKKNEKPPNPRSSKNWFWLKKGFFVRVYLLNYFPVFQGKNNFGNVQLA